MIIIQKLAEVFGGIYAGVGGIVGAVVGFEAASEKTCFPGLLGCPESGTMSKLGSSVPDWITAMTPQGGAAWGGAVGAVVGLGVWVLVRKLDQSS